MKSRFKIILAALLAPVLVPSARADVKPHALISDGMVLQQESPVKIWGTANPGEIVTIKFREQQALVTADDDGRWIVGLESKEAGGPFPMTIAGENTITLKDVLVGEVWFCAGESNMEQPLFHTTGGPEASASSANPKLRLFTVPRDLKDTPQDDVAGRWVESGPSATRKFSALGYWFGSRLQKVLGVPVGLITASYGETSLEAWMSWPALESLPGPKDKHADHARVKAEYDAALAREEVAKAKYARTLEQAKREGKAPPTKPTWLGPLRGPSMVYHAMVAPLLNFRIRGVAWSQGESNGEVGRAGTYGTLFPALIEHWRADWGQGDLPFLFVQVAPNRKKEADPNVLSGMAEVREAQRITSLRVPKTAMVVTTDLGDANGEVQFRRKKPAGERLVLAALAVAYDREVESSGPTVDGVSVDGNKAFIRFTHVGDRLVAGDGRLTGFTIAGPNRRFVTAEAGIEGDTVVVSSPKVLMPVAVRYGWADYPVVNLANNAGLPASPFRTDQFPLVNIKEEKVAMKKGTAATKKGTAATKKGTAENKKSSSPRLPEIQPRLGDRQSSPPASR